MTVSTVLTLTNVPPLLTIVLPMLDVSIMSEDSVASANQVFLVTENLAQMSMNVKPKTIVMPTPPVPISKVVSAVLVTLDFLEMEKIVKTLTNANLSWTIVMIMLDVLTLTVDFRANVTLVLKEMVSFVMMLTNVSSEAILVMNMLNVLTFLVRSIADVDLD